MHEVPPPREIDTWGDTICVELLRESPLVVCKVEMSTARGRQSTVMLHCFASEELTQWGVVVLAAPKELWMEKGDSNVAVCKRHGETRPESTKQISGSYLVINECLHPSSRMAFFCGTGLHRSASSFTAAFCAGSAGLHGFRRVAKWSHETRIARPCRKIFGSGWSKRFLCEAQSEA